MASRSNFPKIIKSSSLMAVMKPSLLPSSQGVVGNVIKVKMGKMGIKVMVPNAKKMMMGMMGKSHKGM